jgi:hypothetical protein
VRKPDLRSIIEFGVIAFAITILVTEGRHGHLNSPAVAMEVDGAICADTDGAPYTPACLGFLGLRASGGLSEAEMRGSATSREAEARGDDSTACADNDNVPYSAGCLRYLSGWFWRAP